MLAHVGCLYNTHTHTHTHSSNAPIIFLFFRNISDVTTHLLIRFVAATLVYISSQLLIFKTENHEYLD